MATPEVTGSSNSKEYSSIAPVQEGKTPELELAIIKAVEAALGKIKGCDTDGFEYESLSHLWDVESQRRPMAGDDNPAWYANALSYWDACEPTVEGMLGGFGVLTDPDVLGSQSFIGKIRERRPNWDRGAVVDCGAGIGRVTKYLLLPMFESVILLEQSAPLIAAAPAYLGPEGAARTTFVCRGMQAWQPEPQSLDCVWVQWVSYNAQKLFHFPATFSTSLQCCHSRLSHQVIGHLSDVDLVTFLQRCKASLKPGGVICIKDNTFPRKGTEHFVVDREDSSMTRSKEYFEEIFKFAGLAVLLREKQRGFPSELYPVLMYCLV